MGLHGTGAAAALLLLGLVTLPASAADAFAASDDLGSADFHAPPPRFTDVDRGRRLASGFAEVDRLMSAFVARERVPGAAWAVIVDDRIAHLGVSGLRDVAAGAPVREDSVFRIASMTKSFTAMAVLQLRDAGRLSLDDPVERYLPTLRGWRYATADSPRLTIRHLLMHSAGLPEDNPWGDQQLAMTEAEFDAYLQRGPAFSNAAGLAYEYSNTGYAILGRVVSRVSGVPYSRFVAERILAPLGMRATTLEPGRVDAERRTLGYRLEDDRWKPEPQLADGAFGAMGGMLTSIVDLGRYVALFLDAYPARDGPDAGPLSRASRREMQQLWRARPATVRSLEGGAIRLDAPGYGYGLRVAQTCEFGQVVGHTGGLPGFGSQMRWLPEYGVGLVAFGNLTYTGWGGVFDAALAALRQTGGLEARVVQPAPALAAARREVNGLLEHWDDARIRRIAAGNLFRDRSLERRRAEFAALQARLGRCVEREGFRSIENALRGEWVLDCERGTALAAVTLAPTIPPGVQHLEVQAVDPAALAPPRTCP